MTALYYLKNEPDVTQKKTEDKNHDRSRSNIRRDDERRKFWNPKNFKDQETPDLPDLTRDEQRHKPTPQQTELERNWTTDQIVANLPRQINDTVITIEQIGLVIYRSRLDKTTIPDIIDANYLQTGLTQREL